MNSFSDRKYQLLLHKIGYLKLELEEKKENLELHEREFSENYTSDETTDVDNSPPEESENSNDAISEKEVQAELLGDGEELETPEYSSDDSSVKDDKDDVLPDEIKRLWKSIAIKTHPDKTNNSHDMTRLYKNALTAYKERKYEVLIEIASILSITIEQPSRQLLEILETRALALETDLKKIKDNVLWAWAAADPEKKKSIEKALRSYRKRKKKKTK